MALDLNIPLDHLSPDPAVKALLNDLQANILKGHGRRHTLNVFLRFDPAAAVANRAWLRALAPRIKTAKQQLDEVKAFKEHGTPGETVRLLFLSASGYAALGLAAKKPIVDATAFDAGMKARGLALNDPDASGWDAHFQGEVHAMILIGDLSDALVNLALTELFIGKPPGVQVLGDERGRANFNGNGDGIEHFGYVDGRSQPLLLQGDVEDEGHDTDGANVWDPAFPVGQVLVKDPGSPGAKGFGSYFVFRKLEQNVRDFKAREEALADHLELVGDDRERAGAMMVGRFEDGTPVVLQKADGMHHPVPNNFTYAADPDAVRCPFHAHIRKSNPRGESQALGATLAQERAHIMARRGITYGERSKAEVEGKLEFTDQPTEGVGLLFMAYQKDIQNMFEFTQGSWVNNRGFVKPKTGVDPVIGQDRPFVADDPKDQHMFPEWGSDPDAAQKSFEFRGFVTLKGGEYFFAPSLSAIAGF